MIAQAASLQRRAMVTSLEVATHANVARSTVSRALRGDPGVCPETRKRVLSAAAALGYYVDVRASSLRRLHAYCVRVVLVCDRPEQLAEELVEGVSLIPELHRLITAIGCKMFVSIYKPAIPQETFIQRLKADVSIIVGKRTLMTRWRSKILHDFPTKCFEYSGEDIENWGTDFLTWLTSAVGTAQATCEIVISTSNSREI